MARSSHHGTSTERGTERVSVLFVCLGNICRYPTAEGVFRRRAEERGLAGRVRVDSAGTGDWHIGSPPDPRARAAAAARGYDLTALRGRQVRAEDLERFDYVLAMDADNLAELERLAPGRARLLLEYAPGSGTRHVPDPYYGEGDGFERVLDLIETAVDGLLDDIEARPATR